MSIRRILARAQALNARPRKPSPRRVSRSDAVGSFALPVPAVAGHDPAAVVDAVQLDDLPVQLHRRIEDPEVVVDALEVEVGRLAYPL